MAKITDRVMRPLEYVGFIGGTIGNGLQTNVFSVFLVVYLNAALGMNPLAVGTMVLVVRIFDAFTDIGFSLIGDRTRTKLGSYRPWMIAVTIPSVIAVIAFFNMPESVQNNPTAATVWMYVWFFLAAAIFLTVHTTSIGAMAITLTPKENERGTLGILRQWGNQASAALIYFFGMSTVLRFSDGPAGVPTKSGFGAMGWFFGIISLVGFLLCDIFVKERVPPVKPGEKVPFSKSFKGIGKNPIAWGSLIANITVQIIFIIFSGLNSYIFTYAIGRADLMSPTLGISMVASLAFTTFVTPQITKRVKKKIYFPAVIVVELFTFLIMFAATGLKSIPLFGIGYALYLCVSSLMATVIFQAMPKGAIYGEYIAGCKIPGMINSLTSYANKISMGVSTVIITAVLAAVGFDASLGLNQTAETIMGLRTCYSIAPIFAMIGAIIGFILIARVKDSRIEEMKKEIAAREAASETSAN